MHRLLHNPYRHMYCKLEIRTLALGWLAERVSSVTPTTLWRGNSLLSSLLFDEVMMFHMSGMQRAHQNIRSKGASHTKPVD